MQELTVGLIALSVTGAFVAGFINTYAGNGSMITLTIMMEFLGLPANVANGSNRLGVLAQSGASSLMFYRDGKLQLQKEKTVILFVSIGAILGVIVATRVSNEQFRTVFSYLLIAIFFVVLMKPKRWLSPKNIITHWPAPFRWIIYLALGFYGGFIQMGMGVISLVIFVLLEGRKMMSANALKVFVTALYTIFVIAIFHYRGMIDWKIGGLFAIGQFVGGSSAAYLASRVKNIDLYAYRILVVMIILGLLKIFDIL